MIESEENKMTPDKPLVLYHGSREGISGNIRPESRSNCDFGAGFYMETNPAQVKGLVSTNTNPVFYEIRFNLTRPPACKKIFLDGTAWLCTVIGFRSSNRRIQNLPAVQKAKEEVNNADLVVGAIADDRMNDALRRFMSNGLSDETLIQCLRSIDYGYQYVLKTPEACSCVKIIRSHLITGPEKQQTVSYSEMKRSESQNIINRMAGRYNREGHFLQEIIENPELLQYQSQDERRQMMNDSLTNVQTAICSNQGELFEYIARTYTFHTFVKFVPAFMNSDFCRTQWDVPYSRYQFDLIDENLDFLMPELKQTIQFVLASDDDRIFDPDTANWIGFTYRLLQILTKIPGRQLVQSISFDDICNAYPGLHTVNEEMAAQRLISDKMKTRHLQ